MAIDIFVMIKRVEINFSAVPATVFSRVQV